ncbi:MAG: D-alanine--D-alanine ligase family protein [Bdellovibrionales bacterium]
MGKSKRVLVLTHPKYRPDRGPKRDGTERDVWLALKRLGHLVHVAGVNEDLGALEHELAEFQPDIVFNLMEEFLNEAVFDFHIVSYLEALEIPFTGCNPRGLILSRNKYLVGNIAAGLGIAIPRTYLLGPGLPRLPRDLPPFPLFVKLNREHASLGIRESNRVTNSRQLAATCARLKRDFKSEMLVQEFISGADVSVSVWGNGKAEVMPPRTLPTKNRDRISTARLKFSPAFQIRHGVKSFPFKGPAVKAICDQSLLLFRHLDLSGYARFDFRVKPTGEPVLIDVNANPNLSRIEDFARSLHSRGWTYIEVIQNILDLGFTYRPNV